MRAMVHERLESRCMATHRAHWASPIKGTSHRELPEPLGLGTCLPADALGQCSRRGARPARTPDVTGRRGARPEQPARGSAILDASVSPTVHPSVNPRPNPDVPPPSNPPPARLGLLHHAALTAAHTPADHEISGHTRSPALDASTCSTPCGPRGSSMQCNAHMSPCLMLRRFQDMLRMPHRM